METPFNGPSMALMHTQELDELLQKKLDLETQSSDKQQLNSGGGG